MTIKSIGGIIHPPFLNLATASPAFLNKLMDAAGEGSAFLFEVPKSGTLDKFEFLLGTVTQAPANGLNCSFQDSDESGDPDLVQDQFRVVTAGLTTDAWVVPGLITSDGTDGGVKRTVTRGDELYCVVTFQSFSAGDSLNIRTINSNAQSGIRNYPLSSHNATGGGWIGAATSGALMALKYDDGTYVHIPGVWAVKDNPTVTFHVDSTPDEVGLIFQLPVPFRVMGMTAMVQANTADDFDVVLYDSDGTTVLESKSVNASKLAAQTQQRFGKTFTNQEVLQANTNYRVALKPTTTGDIQLAYKVYDSPAIMAATAAGANWHYTSRVNAGGWTEVNTRQPEISLLIDGLDDGASAGGMLVHPGMSGGLRG